jgi:hypothetical protein|tara:strand:+ start:7236 stop:7553 length:318 start_codon:yes stop_codon:yes gene_type:complete
MNDNKLIAEFMGLETPDGCYFEHLTKKGNRKLTHHILLNYHTSWDWLMTVVEKIEGLRDENGNAYRFTIDMCNAQIEETNIEILGGAFKIDTTYKAVVEFIKQYK